MSDIKIVISGDVTGLEKATKQAQVELGKTAIAAQKTDSSLLKMGAGVASVGKLAQGAASQVTGLASSMLSGGLISGITLAAAALFELGKSLLDITQYQKNLNEALEGAKSEYVRATVEVYNLRTAFNQAENGIIRKEQALKLYNDTLGKTLGKTKDFEEAEKSFIANANNYIKFTLLKAAANNALAKAAEQAFEIERNKIQGATKEGFFSAQNLVNILSGTRIMSDSERALLRIAEATKNQTDFMKVYNSLMAQANALGFNQVAVEEKQIKVKKEKIKVSRQEMEMLPKLYDVSNDPTQLSRASGSTLTPTVNIQPKLQIEIPESEQRKMLDAFNKFILNEKLKDAINNSISTLINDTISNVAQSVTDALTGGKDVVPRLFDNIIKGIGQQIKELGQYMVKIGIEKLAIDKAIKALGLNPAATIAVGFAAQILGSLLISAASKKSNSLGQGFASGTTGVTESGFYNVNERGQERVFLPRGASVQPANEVQAYGGGQSVFIPSVTLSGTDLVIAFNRASQAMSRNN